MCLASALLSPQVTAAMAEFFRKSSTWAVDYRYDGRARRIFKVIPDGKNAVVLMRAELNDLYGDRAELVEVALASDEEERAFLRGEEPKNVLCPTGRMHRSGEAAKPFDARKSDPAIDPSGQDSRRVVHESAGDAGGGQMGGATLHTRRLGLPSQRG